MQEEDTDHPHNRDRLAIVLSNYFYASTIFVASGAWVVAFAAQIAVTKIVGHEAVGVMWFAVFLQLFLILGVTGIVSGGDISVFRLQACAFSIMAAVFAVIGVDMSIFAHGQPARGAMAAGVARPRRRRHPLVDSMAVGSSSARESTDAERQASSSRSSKGRGYSVSEIRSDGSLDETKVGHEGRGDPHNGSSPEISGDWTGMGRQKIVDRTQEAILIVEEGGEAPDNAQNHSFPPPSSKNRRAVYLEEPRHLSTIYDRSEGTSEDATDPQRDSTSLYPFRVRARSDWIPRSPSEISFKKGDILHSAEKEGKRWWKVRKADGSIGSAPSNYFKVLNS
ncbi:High osmolarity signaling protein SHO1 [Mycena venus]|uniref:High osmolarity signaling protein SHO1 n=1 Tax=Mycena venus TaxID=2733690 RepID=A0A8H7D6Z8_9AGAR|nr:High osmolarity signaling protein SHO1 [Mycena venus]